MEPLAEGFAWRHWLKGLHARLVGLFQCHATTSTVPETARRKNSTKADFISMRELAKGAHRLLIACVGKAAGLYKQHRMHTHVRRGLTRL